MSKAFHGGAFWEAVGPGFDRLDKLADIVSADVLDAWFPPCPGAINALRERTGSLCRTSPPAEGEGLARAISTIRSISESSIVLGAGSSALMFTALREWFTPRSHAVLLQPAYGEYGHVMGSVIGARTEFWHAPIGAAFDVEAVSRRLALAVPDLFVLVNPGNPSGNYIQREEVLDLLSRVSEKTTVWVDEAYLEYVPGAKSLERDVDRYRNLVVCKTMSKVYALSGLRVAYLVCSRDRANSLSRITPPWAVSLPGQIAAVEALADSAYYDRRYSETVEERGKLALDLAKLDLGSIRETQLNFVLMKPREEVARVVQGARDQGVFLRDLATMGAPGWIRIAVKDPEGCRRVISTLRNLHLVAARD